MLRFGTVRVYPNATSNHRWIESVSRGVARVDIALNHLQVGQQKLAVFQYGDSNKGEGGCKHDLKAYRNGSVLPPSGRPHSPTYHWGDKSFSQKGTLHFAIEKVAHIRVIRVKPRALNL